MNTEAHQQGHGSHETNAITRAREDEFEPIQSYPMLKWNGKRSITLIQDDPTRYQETQGPAITGWRSKICWGDSLQAISHLSIELRGKINLIYVTPSLDLKKTHKKSKNRNNAYLQNIFENLILIQGLLSPDGCLYVHCDQRNAHHLRSILDEIIGTDNFINQLMWERTDTHRTAQSYDAIRDTILLYGKSEIHSFYLPFDKFDQGNIERHHVNLADPVQAPSREIRIGYINFNNIDPSKVLTIEAVISSLSSSIGVDTIIDFLGKIPESFL